MHLFQNWAYLKVKNIIINKRITISIVCAKCKENLACEDQSSSAAGMLNM